MASPTSELGALTLGHVLDASGLDPEQVLVIRHTYTADGITSAFDVTPERLQAYTRRQDLVSAKFPKAPPRVWLVFMADGALRSRLVAAYENRGEVRGEQTATLRWFDLHPIDALSTLRDRLVIEWSKDPVNWAKSGTKAATFPVVEIADPQVVPFPGLDSVRLPYAELRQMVGEPRYRDWQTALKAVQGIYLIADRSSGRLYVGKADGSERILGRWSTYAKDGHGGNQAMIELKNRDPDHPRHYVFSLLRVFGPSTPTADIDAAEEHFKRTMLTREFGLNRG